MKSKKIIPLIIFIIGFGLMIFTRTTTYISIAMIVAPIFILQYLREQKPLKGILLTILGFFLAFQISLWNLFDFDNGWLTIALNVARNLGLAIIFALPYLLDRIFCKRIKGYKSTFIFPVLATVIYFLASRFGPFDGTGIFYAYTQFGIDSSVQMLSIFGLWGMVFLNSWISAAVCWIWEEGLIWESIKKGTVVTMSIVLSLMIIGGAIVSPMFYDYNGKTVRAAAITLPYEDEEVTDISAMLNERKFSSIDNRLSVIEGDVKTAAAAGAKIVTMQEYSMILQADDESQAKEELKRMATENDVYLAISYVTFPELLEGEHETDFLGNMILDDEKEEGFNKAILINADGEIEIEYYKQNLGSGEGTWIQDVDDEIQVVDSPYGRIGMVICRDMEYPEFMIQAGRKNADIILCPAYENVQSLSVTYNQMMRAVENGFSFVRSTKDGFSIAIDHNGNTLSSKNDYVVKDHIMLADLPTQGVKTIYSVIGDLIVWLSIAGIVVFVVLLFTAKCKRKEK